jgi:nicotinate-nucleotide pyrophosphorylase (carboxylating)
MSNLSSPALKFGPSEEAAARRLIRIALSEDLGEDTEDFGRVNSTLDSSRDRTCAALVSAEETATIEVVVRRTGVLAGSPIGPLVFEQLDPTIRWDSLAADGHPVAPGEVIARVSGSLRSLLIGERTVLNFLAHLSGVASETRRYVDAIVGTKAVILDTRKTLPGWRALQKYAVRCGGGTNHRLGLHDGVLIKDNHLAAWGRERGSEVRSQPGRTIAEAVRQARTVSEGNVPIEVEVDTLDQLRDALAGNPDIVLLDNMTPAMLRQAVQLRDECSAKVQLEASGGITLSNVREIAATGVDRISIGALTHSAPALDIAFDWPAYHSTSHQPRQPAYTSHGHE